MRRQGSVGPPGEPAVVELPSRRAGRGQEALVEGWQWLGGPLGGPEGVGKSPQRDGKGWEAIVEARQGS